MGCCGQKRQALNYSSGTLQNESANDEKYLIESSISQQSAVFRYTGNQSLTVKGISGNNKYYFSAAIPELLVQAEDTALMRGYSELIELKKQH
jgi:hypothetical protein